MASTAKGFAMSSGLWPPPSGIAVLCETPAANEISYIVRDLPQGDAELLRRRERYPEIDDRFIRLGAPVVGRTGFVLWGWMMEPKGLPRTQVTISNVLSCFPGMVDGAVAYPTGATRKKAEGVCADLWLRQLTEWDPTISVGCIHPAAIAREVTPLPMCLRAIEKSKEFAAKGERVLILMGGKATASWWGYGSNVTRYCASHQFETPWTRARRAERWDSNRRISMVKKVREKKLTVRTALQMLLATAKPLITVDGLSNVPSSLAEIQERGYTIDFKLTEVTYNEMLALLTPKPKMKVSQCDISHEASTSEITTQVMVPVLK